jgi:DHA1 family bicyclomycin/chloramphenicol resistance-like MFS transporter
MIAASDSAARPVSSLPLNWLILLGGLVAIGPLSTDMYLPAFPAMARDLGGRPGAMAYTLASYFVGLALGQLVYGPVSDRFGRRRPFLAGLALYVVASLGCALAGSVESLVAWRFLQALGGCSSMVIVRAVVRDRCEAREAAKAFSMLILVMGVTPLLAPLLGGWMGVNLGWRSIFWFMLLFGALSLLAVGFGLPETHDTRHEPPLRPGRILADYASLLASRAFLGYTLVGGFGFAGMFAYIANSPFVLIELHGVRPESFGWLFGVIAFGYVAASQINARLLNVAPPTRLLRVAVRGPALAGLLLALGEPLVGPSLPWVMAGFFVYVASMGFIGPNAAAAALATHGQMAGKASALMGSLQFGLATLAGGLVGLWHDGGTRPLVVIMALGGIGAWLALRWVEARLPRGRRPRP